MRAILTLLTLLMLVGCDGDRIEEKKPDTTAPPTLAPPEAPKPGKDGKTDPLEQAKFEMQRLKEAAAQAEARYETMKKIATDDAIRAQTMWITGICLLLAAVAGVAAFLVPVGKKTLAAAAAGLVAIAACAQAFQWAIPYLPWVGGAIIIGGGVIAVINWRKLADAARTAADHGDRIEEWLKDLPEDARDQALKVVAEAKAEAKKQADRLGIHKELQYLRGKAPSLWQRVVKQVA